MEITRGDIVNCGAYGEKIYVCYVDGDTFWGTDEIEQYERGRDAGGWYFKTFQVKEIIGNVEDD